MIGPRRYPPGAPCLSALRSTDVSASVDFYARLFAWTPTPPAPNGFVIMMRDDLPVAGVGPVFDPAHDVRWCTYIAAANADRTTRAVEAAGGTVRIQPFDVPGIARVAVVTDDQGAELWIWQPYAFVGAEVAAVAGAVCGRVLTAPEPDRARSFYAEAFGWTAAADEFRFGEEVVGEWRGTDLEGAFWTPVVAVDDLQATTATARSLGAATAPPVAGTGSVLIQDPLGAELLVRRTGR